jgi:hypothetical protein
MTSPSREAFEAWAKEYGRIFLERDGNGYKFPYTQEAWVSWQAAIQHARDVAVQKCEEHAFCEIDGHTERACHACADAIKEALK